MRSSLQRMPKMDLLSCRVSTVDKQQLRRSIFGILSRLLLSNLRKIPNVEATGSSAGSEDGLVMRAPLHLEDLILMRLEAVELEFEVPEIPQSDSFICGSRGQDELRVRVEGEAVDLGGVRVNRVARPVVNCGTRVPDHQLLVVGNGTK